MSNFGLRLQRNVRARESPAKRRDRRALGPTIGADWSIVVPFGLAVARAPHAVFTGSGDGNQGAMAEAPPLASPVRRSR